MATSRRLPHWGMGELGADSGLGIALAGDSSGAAIATLAAIRLRGMVHGFPNLDDVSPAAARAGDDVLQRFSRLLPRD